jgi:hypothetical protein
VVKLVDTGDSKSPALKSVPVRVRPLVPNSNTRLLGGCFCLCHMVGEKWHRVRQIELAIWTPKQREGGVKPREVSTRYFELVRPF